MSDEFDIEELLREVHELLNDEDQQRGSPNAAHYTMPKEEKQPIREEWVIEHKKSSPQRTDRRDRQEEATVKASVPAERQERVRRETDAGQTLRSKKDRTARKDTAPERLSEKKTDREVLEKKLNGVGRGRKILRSVPFFTALALITVIAWLLPLRDTVSVKEKRELEKFPAFSVQTLSDGSYFSGIGTWFSDSFTFRDTWMGIGDFVEAMYGRSSITLTGSIAHTSAVPSAQPKAAESTSSPAAPSAETGENTEAAQTGENTEAPEEADEEEDERLSLDEVLAGKEYTATSTAIVMDGNVYPATVFSEYYSDIFARHMSDAAELLDGKARVFSVLPLRCTSPMLSRSFRDYVGFIPEEDVLDYMFTRMGDKVFCVDTLTPLAKHSNEYIYFHSDHHWTALGAYYAYEEWAKVAGFEPVSLSEYTEGIQEPYTGTYYHNNTAKNPVYEDQVYTYDPPGDIQLFIVENGEKDSPDYRGYEQDVVTYMYTSDKYCAFLAGDHALCTFINNDIEDESACLIIKDSNGNPFSYYFTQHYKYVYVMDYRIYTRRTLSNFVDTYGVNDVIFCTSMFLAQGEGCNSLLKYFIK